MKVYIVILNYNSFNDTIDCLESIIEWRNEKVHIIIIDNKSPNQSSKKITNWLFKKNVLFDSFDEDSFQPDQIVQDVAFIQASSNRGFAAGNNIFLKHTHILDAYIWLVNPDIIVPKGCLEKILKAAKQLPDNTIFSNLINKFDAPDKTLSLGCSKINFWKGTITDIKSKNRIDEADYLYGGSLFTHAKNYTRYGLLPEQYFLYWEETHWCYAAKLKGAKFHICNDAVVYDKVGGSIGRGYLADYYYTLNGLRFISSYYYNRVYIVTLFIFLRIFKRLLLFRFARAKAMLLATKDYFQKYRKAI